ncbi:Gfo/Idh/MocA family oxidoreductase [Clostridiaceae bacterium M8S5]|nr:Gfo/Idh/MocA family oxidoreductase [Clostridiaceae bacterium M8S5]
MKNRRIRTVVCGTTFGQFYMEALKILEDKFELVGLLARGSERSKMCSRNYNVKLYTNIDDLPKDIDLACVVMRSGALGGKGTETAMKFLERGVDVIQEQPIHHKDLEKCYRAARKNNRHFQTGNLYCNLKEVRRFIECAKEMNKIQKPLYLNAKFAPQVSYPAMAILLRAMPSIRALDIHMVNKDSGPFYIITGRLGKTPITFEIHNQIDPTDPDNYMHLLHSITIMYESGRLSLTDTHGPVIWNPRMHVPTTLYNTGIHHGELPEHLFENSTHILGDFKPANYKDIVTKKWTKAVSEDLLSIREMMQGNNKDNQKAQRELLSSKQWHKITKTVGFAELLHDCKHKHLPAEVLKEIAMGIDE